MQEKIALYYQEGSSDKEYHASLEQSGDGWVVNFLYGRRGSTLKGGTKTASPVAYEAAKKVYDKLVKSKVSEGYQADGSAAASYQTVTGKQKLSGHEVQLLNPIDEFQLEQLLRDPEWGAQEKMDGERRQARRTAGQAIGSNRNGEQVALSAMVERDLLRLDAELHIDGESIGEQLHVFDLLQVNHIDMRGLPFETRHAQLVSWVVQLGSPVIHAVPLAKTEAEKRALLAQLRARNAEGIVFHRLAANYSAGRPNSGGDVLKFKFVERVTARVLAAHDTKRSVSIGVTDEQGNLLNVGNVTILPNFDIPSAGELVEVQYLYFYDGGSLFQPVYLGPRRDKNVPDTLASLKRKAGQPQGQLVLEVA